MNYWELRDIVKDIIPRRGSLEKLDKSSSLVKEKGRKVNYHQFSLDTGQMELQQHLLNKDEIKSFLEVSLRAAHCPMPLNADVYDAVRCPFRCMYCFADSFRASLYTSFFDNSKQIGLRTCKPEFFRPEMDKLMKHRGSKNQGSELQRAISMQIPIRLGIRFEDFLPIEDKKEVSLNFLSYLKDEGYPVMINTKSSVIGKDKYVRVLSDNKGGAAVHVTMITSDDGLNRLLEPGASSFQDRIKACKALSDAGVRVVARIEPFMVFLVDQKEEVDKWIKAVKWAGIKHVTLDTYSWSSTTPGIRRQIESLGIDWSRMFLLMSDSQWLGSLLLSKFMEYLRDQNLFCSTFDFGSAPSNDQDICCQVGDYFKSRGAGFSYGNNLMAIRFIYQHLETPSHWYHYEKYVEKRGGWLSDSLRHQVHQSWNLLGNAAYFPDWGSGIELYGMDQDGNRIWRYNSSEDFREELLKGLI